MAKFKVAILRNETPHDHELWIEACENFADSLDYDVIDLSAYDWYEKITSKQYDYFLAKPPGQTAKFKQLYDERIYIIDEILNIPNYPSPSEIYIYENKRFLSFWLRSNSIPHPRTTVFYKRNEAEDFVNNHKMPIVAKSNIGASGSGVKIMKSVGEVRDYISSSFDGKGSSKRWGPNFEKGKLLQRGMKYVFHPSSIKSKIQIYNSKRQDVQRGFVLFQEFIPHEYEWRVVRIGDSFFAHKKLKIGEKASGSTLKKYDNPPLNLLDFVKEITDMHALYSQAVDIFLDEEKGYLINEMQCIFGQSDEIQMLVDGKPGRYRFINNDWKFEEGLFNVHESYDLRVSWVLGKLKEKKQNS